MAAHKSEILLEINDLQAGFTIKGQFYPAVDQLSFQLKQGKVTCVVGESGSGKSVMALSIMDLLPKENARRSRGAITFNGENLMDLTAVEMNRIRGKEIGYVFQEPMTAFNPILTIGYQLEEALYNHLPLSKQQRRKRAIELLLQVGMTRAESLINAYPHQLSGGMRQRAMIAMAIACEPKLLIADEPTTALDVAIQAQILELLKSLQQQRSMSILLITHNLGVVAEMADEVIVMYCGQIVEQGEVDQIFHEAKHPYLQLMLQLIPRLDLELERFNAIEGSIPSLMNIPQSGCRFAPRCPDAMERCHKETPLLADAGANHHVRCFLYPCCDPANTKGEGNGSKREQSA